MVDIESGEIKVSSKEDCYAIEDLDETARKIILNITRVRTRRGSGGYTSDSSELFISIGDKETVVIHVMGEPDFIIESTFNTSKVKWFYGNSRIYFYKGKVIDWEDVDRCLKVKKYWGR